MKVLIGLLIILLLIGCTDKGVIIDSSDNESDVVIVDKPTVECTIDSDCVKAQCCHATSCVPKEKAPDCSEIMCTMGCEPGTTDCGGGCYCNNGKCEAILNEMSHGQVPQ